MMIRFRAPRRAVAPPPHALNPGPAAARSARPPPPEPAGRAASGFRPAARPGAAHLFHQSATTTRPGARRRPASPASSGIRGGRPPRPRQRPPPVPSVHRPPPVRPSGPLRALRIPGAYGGGAAGRRPSAARPGLIAATWRSVTGTLTGSRRIHLLDAPRRDHGGVSARWEVLPTFAQSRSIDDLDAAGTVKSRAIGLHGQDDVWQAAPVN